MASLENCEITRWLHAYPSKSSRNGEFVGFFMGFQWEITNILQENWKNPQVLHIFRASLRHPGHLSAPRRGPSSSPQRSPQRRDLQWSPRRVIRERPEVWESTGDISRKWMMMEISEFQWIIYILDDSEWICIYIYIYIYMLLIIVYIYIYL